MVRFDKWFDPSNPWILACKILAVYSNMGQYNFDFSVVYSVTSATAL
jgi:hypothetical protein